MNARPCIWHEVYWNVHITCVFDISPAPGRRVKELCEERQAADMFLTFAILFWDIMLVYSWQWLSREGHLCLLAGLKLLSLSPFGAAKTAGDVKLWFWCFKMGNMPLPNLRQFINFGKSVINHGFVSSTTWRGMICSFTLQVLGSTLFLETEPAQGRLQTTSSSRGQVCRNWDNTKNLVCYRNKMKQTDCYGFQWRILTRSCSSCAPAFIMSRQKCGSKMLKTCQVSQGATPVISSRYSMEVSQPSEVQIRCILGVSRLLSSSSPCFEGFRNPCWCATAGHKERILAISRGWSGDTHPRRFFW